MLPWSHRERQLLGLLTRLDPRNGYDRGDPDDQAECRSEITGRYVEADALIRKLYRPRWGTKVQRWLEDPCRKQQRRGAPLTTRERQSRDRLIERLRGLRRRINAKLGEAGNPLRVLGNHNGALTLDQPREPSGKTAARPQQTRVNQERIDELLREACAGHPNIRLLRPRQRYGLAACVDLVRVVLKGGPVDATCLNNCATKKGFKSRTLRRACKQLQVQHTKDRSASGRWTVRLPGQ
jgi:hypothetical protein